MIRYIQKILHIFSSTEQSKETIEDVHEWLVDDTDYVDEKTLALREIWDNTENTLSFHQWDTYKKVSQIINKNNEEIPKNRYLLSWKYVAAISLLLIISVSTTYLFTKNLKENNFSESIVEHFCPIADRDSLLLPDGSRVLTNSSTLLIYPKNFGKKERIIYLIGEANFTVKKDPKRPFIVKTKYIDITALGTEFDVKSYADENTIHTTLIEGCISVKSKIDDKNCILMAGEQLIYNKTNRGIQLVDVDLLDVTAWQRGEIFFKGIEMEEILGALERKYEIKFQYPKGMFNGDKYSFRFKEKAPLPELMDIIQMIVGSFNYKIKGKICHLSQRKRRDSN